MGWRLRILARNISHAWQTELGAVDSGSVLSTGLANHALTGARVGATRIASNETRFAEKESDRQCADQTLPGKSLAVFPTEQALATLCERT